MHFNKKYPWDGGDVMSKFTGGEVWESETPHPPQTLAQTPETWGIFPLYVGLSVWWEFTTGLHNAARNDLPLACWECNCDRTKWIEWRWRKWNDAKRIMALTVDNISLCQVCTVTTIITSVNRRHVYAGLRIFLIISGGFTGLF